MAISYNSTSRFNEDSSSSSTTTWSHTCNASDTKLIVICGGRSAITGITYNGVSMTKISDQTSGSYQFNSTYYLDNPPTGNAYNIVATYSSSNQYRSALAVGLSGATAGIGATGSNDSNFVVSVPKTVTSSITTTVNNSHIFTIPNCNDYSFVFCTFGASQTEILRNTAANWGFAFQYKVKATAGADTTTLTNTGAVNNIMITSFELKEAAPTNTVNFLMLM